jgi:transposase
VRRQDGVRAPRRALLAVVGDHLDEKFGVSAETLRNWVRRAETDEGLRPGLTTDEREHLKGLEREVRELRRANEILKSAAAFFGAELDRRPTR